MPIPEICMAVRSGSIELVKELVAAGADINARECEDAPGLYNPYMGNTPLMFAATNHELKMLRFLISAGADVDAVDAQGWTSLMWANFTGDHTVANILRKAGAKSKRLPA